MQKPNEDTEDSLDKLFWKLKKISYEEMQAKVVLMNKKGNNNGYFNKHTDEDWHRLFIENGWTWEEYSRQWETYGT